MITIELENRSGVAVEEAEAAALSRRVLAAEGVVEGDLGIAFAGPEEIRALKAEHLGLDEATDVLSFPIDGMDDLPEGLPASSATWSSARRSWARTGAPRSCTGSCTCSATTTEG